MSLGELSAIYRARMRLQCTGLPDTAPPTFQSGAPWVRWLYGSNRQPSQGKRTASTGRRALLHPSAKRGAVGPRPVAASTVLCTRSMRRWSPWPGVHWHTRRAGGPPLAGAAYESLKEVTIMATTARRTSGQSAPLKRLCNEAMTIPPIGPGSEVPPITPEPPIPGPIPGPGPVPGPGPRPGPPPPGPGPDPPPPEPGPDPTPPGPPPDPTPPGPPPDPTPPGPPPDPRPPEPAPDPLPPDLGPQLGGR
jgi:hypothetical protein